MKETIKCLLRDFFLILKLNESSGLTLGCALIELIHGEKIEADKILLILDLLQVSCAESNDVIYFLHFFIYYYH